MKGLNTEVWAGVTGTKRGEAPRDYYQREAISSPGTERESRSREAEIQRTGERLPDCSCGHKVEEK